MSNPDNKIELLGVKLEDFKNYLKEYGIKSYRAEQVFNWIYKNGVFTLENMKNIPDSLTEKLKNIVTIENLELLGKSEAKDGTIKYLWKLSDGETIESVYLPYYEEGRHSVCISTQVGCNMGCSFCATGLEGLKRNLSSSEIMAQVLQIQKDIGKENFLDPAVSNVVFMGMGEPMNNLDNVLNSVNILNSKSSLNIGMRKMTISTAGVVPGIKELAVRNKQIGLAVSLNAPNDSLRSKIMPINNQYPLKKLIDTVKEYIEITNRRVTFEYVMMENVNDAPEHAYQLSRLISDILCHVNLIPVNPVSELDVYRPDIEKIEKFREILIAGNIDTTIRQERGVEIEAACGQLKREGENYGV
ncbi:MAG: 23S rRNA (adenine(2503)-C(2))-methyltransferase RlmN [Bacillota bacterium]